MLSPLNNNENSTESHNIIFSIFLPVFSTIDLLGTIFNGIVIFSDPPSIFLIDQLLLYEFGLFNEVFRNFLFVI